MAAGPPNLQEAMQVLYLISQALNGETGLDKLFNVIMDGALKLTKAERGFVILYKAGSGLDVAATRNLKKEAIDHPDFQVSRGIIFEALKTGMPVIVDNAAKDVDFMNRQSVMTLRLASVACVPLKEKGKILGVLYLDNRYRTGLFGAEHLVLLETFANNAAVAISKLRPGPAPDDSTSETL